MPHSIQTSQWVPFPVELVFAFFANPANLPHLMPTWQKARLESSHLLAPPIRPLAGDPALRYRSPAAGTGSEITLSFRPVRSLPFRITWLGRITDFTWNSHFLDEQVEGPFTHWKHCHRIVTETREEVAGTSISDEVEYDLPLGPVGRLAIRSS